MTADPHKAPTVADHAATHTAARVATQAIKDSASIMSVLPPQAVELVGLIGFEATMKLCRDCGGVRFIVPMNPPKDDHKMVALLGRAVTDLLVGAIGGAPFEVPLLAALERLLRDNAIRAEFDAGASMEDLSIRYRMSSRHIRTILSASASTSPRQQRRQVRDPFTLDLFADPVLSA